MESFKCATNCSTRSPMTGEHTPETGVRSLRVGAGFSFPRSFQIPTGAFSEIKVSN